ncbi:hypothetical protein F4777DRAFT_543939 [Nemania sp. FL0916]|nr:hypothetical protein F4777DRAFT_543939 [Nemania sp. FL0916]
MAEKTGTSYSTDPALYIYTSLTAGSSHIVTATSRLETILRANRVPFKALDIATDEKARMIWGRRAGKDESGRVRKLPALIQMGMVLGDLVEIEEWNEYGELKEHVTIYFDEFTIPPKSQAPPPMAMRPLNQPFPRTGVASPSAPKPATSTTVTPTKTTTGAPAPPPPAPPLPTDKDKTKIPLSSPGSTGTAKKPAAAATKTTAPIHNIAAEAAEKAKKVQLERLREKVHGKQDSPTSPTTGSKGGDKDKSAAASPTTAKKVASPADSAAKGISKLAIGAAASTSPAAAKANTRGADAGVTEHRGSAVVNASPAEIAAIEKAEAIPEADSSEEEDSDEDEDDEDEDEEDDDDDDDDDDEDDDEDDDDEDEEDDDDEDDDDEDDEDDDDEDEESEDDVKKGAAVKKS